MRLTTTWQLTNGGRQEWYNRVLCGPSIYLSLYASWRDCWSTENLCRFAIYFAYYGGRAKLDYGFCVRIPKGFKCARLLPRFPFKTSDSEAFPYFSFFSLVRTVSYRYFQDFKSRSWRVFLSIRARARKEAEHGNVREAQRQYIECLQVSSKIL